MFCACVTWIEGARQGMQRNGRLDTHRGPGARPAAIRQKMQSADIRFAPTPKM